MWDKIPAVRILLPFITGILIGLHVPINFIFIQVLFFTAFGIFCLFTFIKSLSVSFKLQYIRGFVLLCVLFAGGIYLVQLNDVKQDENFYGKYLQKESIAEARILFPPEETEKSIKLIVNIESITNGEVSFETQGKSLIYLRKDSTLLALLKYGDIVYLENHFREVEEIKNPHEFNYKKYLANQGVYYTAFFNEGEYVLSGENKSKVFWSMIFRSRLYFEHLLQKYIHDEDALAVSSALLLGVRTDIRDDIQQAYANTGTMHILSVSGLHVGILFIILDTLMNLIRFFKINKIRNKFIKAFVIVFIIWFYACVTGLSPSVARSAVMFSFLIFGKIGIRYVNSFNILAASAIPLLIINPYMITQVGFQLSYLAILGILTFQPPITNLYSPSNRAMKYVWSLTTVSIAAQLGTVPVTMFYFHQFPNYFLLSNVLAIPVSFIVLVAGIAFFSLSFITQINFITGGILEWSMRLLNFVVVSIDKIPGALTDKLYITIPETIVFYIILFFAGTFIFIKQRKYIMWMCGFTFILCLSVGIRKYLNSQQDGIIIYSLPKSFVVSEVHGKEASIFSSDTLNERSPDFTYHMKGDLLSHGIKQYTFINILDSANVDHQFRNFIQVDTTIFYCVNAQFDKPDEIFDQVDYVIVMNNPYLKIEELKETFPKSTLLFCGSNSFKSLNYWKQSCNKLSVKYSDLKNNGYLSTL